MLKTLNIAPLKTCSSHTIALLNIYRNPQNSSQSADGLRCKFIQVPSLVPWACVSELSVRSAWSAAAVTDAPTRGVRAFVPPTRGNLF